MTENAAENLPGLNEIGGHAPCYGKPCESRPETNPRSPPEKS
jgi:hypothetical protein